MSISEITLASGRELIDATQNAMMGAATNVGNILNNEAIAHEETPLYMDAEFWVACAFVFVVIALFRPIVKAGSGMIHKRIEGIKQRIADSENLLTDAQKLLSDYERKYRNAKKEANAITEKAEKQINYIKTEKMSALEQEVKNKEKEASDRIKATQESASQELTTLTSELTIKLVRQAINDNLSSKTQSKLIDDSIKIIGNLKR